MQLYDNIFCTIDIDLSLKYKQDVCFHYEIKSPIASPIRKCGSCLPLLSTFLQRS